MDRAQALPSASWPMAGVTHDAKPDVEPISKPDSKPDGKPYRKPYRKPHGKSHSKPYSKLPVKQEESGEPFWLKAGFRSRYPTYGTYGTVGI